jgi:membrane protein DedA with SNARE-associated domain
MESLLDWLTSHADSAHFIIFGLLMLAGFSLPVSEEFMLIASGVLASSVIPDHTVHLFIAVFLGCYFSDWIAYWLGRQFGEKLFQLKWLPFSLNENRLKRVEYFYNKYGFFTLFVGRFIPFGVRNGIFMSAGVGKMHFGKFIISDGIGCFIFSLLIFSLSYYFGKNYEDVQTVLHHGGLALFGACMLCVLAAIIYLYVKKKTSARRDPIV